MSSLQHNSDIPMGPNPTDPDDFYYEEVPSPFYYVENHRSPLRRTRSTHGRLEAHRPLDKKPPQNVQAGSNGHRSTTQHGISPPVYRISKLMALANREALQSVQIKSLSRPQIHQPIIAKGTILRYRQITNSSQRPKAQYLFQSERFLSLSSSQRSTQPQPVQDVTRPRSGMYENISTGMQHVNCNSSSFDGNAQQPHRFQNWQTQVKDGEFGLLKSVQCQQSSSDDRVVYEMGIQPPQSVLTPLRRYEPGHGAMYPSMFPTSHYNGRSYSNPMSTAPGIDEHNRPTTHTSSARQAPKPFSTMISLLYGPALQEKCSIAATREVRIPLENLHKYAPSQDMRDLAYEIFRKHIPLEREWARGAISRVETEAFCQWGSRDDLPAAPAPQYWAQRVMQQVLIREWPYWYFDAELGEKEQYKGQTRKFADSLKTFRLHRERRQVERLQHTRETQRDGNSTAATDPYTEESRKQVEGEPQGIQAIANPDNAEINLADRAETVEGQESQMEEAISSTESQVKKEFSSPEEPATRATTPVSGSQRIDQGSSDAEELERLSSMYEGQQHSLEGSEYQERSQAEEDLDTSTAMGAASEQLSSEAPVNISAEVGQSGTSEDKVKRKQGKKGKKNQWRRLAVDYPLPPTPL